MPAFHGVLRPKKSGPGDTMALGRLDPKTWMVGSQARHLMSLHSHPFYQRLNQALVENNTDGFVEDACRSFYDERRGRPSVPPSLVFRMWLIGRVEGILSQRALAWRCRDSLTLRDFLWLEPTDPVPDHSTLSVLKSRIPGPLREEILERMLKLARARGLIRPRSPYSGSFMNDPE